METNLNEDLTNKSEVNENFDHKNLERNGENQIEEQKLKPQEFSKSDNDSLKNFETIVQNVEKRAKDNISNVEMLLKSGLLNQVQGEILIQQIIKKGYAERSRTEEDRRVVLVSLTEKGKYAYEIHENFHKEMVQAPLDSYNDEEHDVLCDVIEKINTFFEDKYEGLQ